MKTKLLACLILSVLLFSCQKDDSLSDPNAELLLKKEIYNTGYHKQYFYNAENNIIGLEYYYHDTLNDRIEFRYNKEGMLAFIDFPFTKKYPNNSDSIKYFLDESYYIYYTNFIYNKVIFYLNENNQIIRQDFLEEDEIIYYTITDYINTNESVLSYYGHDGYFAGDIRYTYDLKKNSPTIFGISKIQLGNIIKIESDFLDDEGLIHIDFDGHAFNHAGIIDFPPYTSSFEYNIQGYPTKELRTYAGATEPEITYYVYRVAN